MFLVLTKTNYLTSWIRSINASTVKSESLLTSKKDDSPKSAFSPQSPSLLSLLPVTSSRTHFYKYPAVRRSTAKVDFLYPLKP